MTLESIIINTPDSSSPFVRLVIRFMYVRWLTGPMIHYYEALTGDEGR